VYLVLRNVSRYAEIYIKNCTGFKAGWRVNRCEEVLGLIKLVGIIQKPTVRSHVTRARVLETSVFPEVVSFNVRKSYALSG
jgi:hypothetical protein